MLAPLLKQQTPRSGRYAAALAAIVVVGWAAAGQTAPPGGPPSETDISTAANRQPTKTAPPPCADGEPRDDSGACPVVDDAPATRGFELYAGPLPAPGSQAAPVAKVADSGRPASGATDCGEACDLKIGFKSGSAALTRPTEARLTLFAKALVAAPLAGKRFEIAGHTDASGSPARNLALSQARAEAVVAFLGVHGVPVARLTAKGYGAEGLALPDHPLDPRNRRVEARVLP